MAGAQAASADFGRRVTILGSTGSVGCSTLDLIAMHRDAEGEDAYPIEALTANRNVELLVAQARKYRPRLAVIGDEAQYGALKDGLAGTGIQAAAGHDALCEAAACEADWVMAAIVGAAGLKPTLEAVRRGADVALANKECLVCAGPLMVGELARSGSRLLPVDSEHNAIFQVFEFECAAAVERVILTASGGPFRTWTKEQMAAATPQQAVAHPNWSMGAKISVDSATMMNKGLELIEAFYLFPLAEQQIEILVHPQSIIHSMVGYADGSILAQLGSPDMRTPIAHALAWPARIGSPAPRLNFTEIGSLTFEAPDPERFPALRLARHALQSGGGAPTVLNAANEEAVGGFLEGRLGFLRIAEIVEGVLARMEGDIPGGMTLGDLEDVYTLDMQTRAVAREIMNRVAEPV